MASTSHAPCSLIDRFSLTEKLIMRIGWFGFMAVGAIGMFRQDPLWAMLYVLCATAAFLLVVLPGLCAHCPYPSQFSTCLFLPAGLVKRFYPYRGPQMSPLGKIAVAAVMVAMVAVPQFWLIREPALLGVFWVLAVPLIAAFPLHYCRCCRHEGCPMNRVDGHNL